MEAMQLPRMACDPWPSELAPVMLYRHGDVDPNDDEGAGAWAASGGSLRAEEAGSSALQDLEWRVEVNPAPAPDEFVQIVDHIDRYQIEEMDYAVVLPDQPAMAPGCYCFRHEADAAAFADSFGGKLRPPIPSDHRQIDLFAA